MELKPMLSGLTLNNIMRMVAGKRYYGDEVTDEDEVRELRELIAEAFMSRVVHLVLRQRRFSVSDVNNKHGYYAAVNIAGTDTSTVILEWTMFSLLNHPQVLRRDKVEIDREIGEENLIDESDVSKLKYL
ncbi:hypothetical protein V6N13_067836 [Hibiscus sabdariffa]|uniref:Cytochrome P450 n=1 Tax=Hibiscus sabdariffa TaxID=183260 RepID=A0ABR2DW75_9ROSI